MKKIGIVTDSHSGISQETADQLQIRVLPMPFYIEGECYYEGVTLTREAFFEKLHGGAEVSTSQPSPVDVMKIWDEALAEYEQILYMPLSSGLSGSYMTAAAMAAAAVGSVLHIKPVLKLDVGKLDSYKKCRGFAKARRIMIDALKEDLDTRFKEWYDRNEVCIMEASSATPEQEHWESDVPVVLNARKGLYKIIICS